VESPLETVKAARLARPSNHWNGEKSFVSANQSAQRSTHVITDWLKIECYTECAISEKILCRLDG
jgi:hypothetical protein